MDKYTERTRCLFLKDEVDSSMLEGLVGALPYLAARDSQKPIVVHLDSWGGSLDDCGAIVDSILACEAPVYTVAMGPAYSAAAIILALGQPGCRAINRYGSVLFHAVKVGSDYDSPKNVEGAAKFTARLSTVFNKEVCRCTDLKYRDFSKTLGASKELWYTAREAKACGIVDMIWTPTTARRIYRQARDNTVDLTAVKE
jgi:ATP-dependent Clp protease protease subunit